MINFFNGKDTILSFEEKKTKKNSLLHFCNILFFVPDMKSASQNNKTTLSSIQRNIGSRKIFTLKRMKQ